MVANGIKAAAGTAVFAAILLGAAGTLAWASAWIYLGSMVAVLGVYSWIVARRHPGLMAERRQPPADAKSWDRPLVVVIGKLGPFAFIVVAGLDHRFAWTGGMPLTARIFGLILVLSGGAVTNWAVAENAFFSALVRIQRDRNHQVVDTGPYRMVRHPGYLGSLLAGVGGPLLLGSLWALAVNLLVAIVVVVRTALEDRALRGELEGYEAYAARVRWRLAPFVW